MLLHINIWVPFMVSQVVMTKIFAVWVKTSKSLAMLAIEEKHYSINVQSFG